MPANLPVTDLEDERIFLERLIEPSNREPVPTFWQLVRFYRLAEKNDLASTLIFHMVEAHDSVENKAYCYLALGQIAEVRGQYDAAVDLYTRGLTFRTPDTTVKYFLYNNTGFSLNAQEKYRAADYFCRQAIEIDCTRANAFKNLGLSFAGPNHLVGAAWTYVEGIKADSSDPRCLQLLKKLVADHPELAYQFTLTQEAHESERTKEH